MSKKLIDFNFNGAPCSELDTLERIYPISVVDTKFRNLPETKEIKTDFLTAETLANYVGAIKTQHLMVGAYENGYVCEYQRSGGNMQIAVAKEDPARRGEYTFLACEADTAGLLYPFGPGHKGTVFLMALLPVLLEEPEAASFVDVIRMYKPEEEKFSEAMCGLFNNLYYRVKTGEEFPVSMLSMTSAPGKMTQKDIDAVKISSVICGEPKMFSRSTTPAKAKPAAKATIKADEIRDMFKYDPEWELSPEEEERVPDLGDWYIVSPLGTEMAQKIALSRKFRRPLDTAQLYGPSGTGKTYLVKQIAEQLGLPYYSSCPGADADTIDLLDKFIPNADDTETIEQKCRRLGIPTFEEIDANYVCAFEALFGRKPDKLDSPADAYREISERLMNAGGAGKDFVHVESEIVKALRNGGVLEIQEADVIKRASVMTILNPILNGNEKNDFIQLANGEILRRNKNCIIFFTTNRAYEGCNNLQQSIFSRIALKREVRLPQAEVLYQRAKADSNFSNDALLRKMSQMTVDIHNYLIEKDITSGVCGPRELSDWAIDTMISAEIAGRDKPNDEDAIRAGLETIIEAVAQDPDDRDDVITAIFKKAFSVSTVDAISKEMAKV